MTRCLLDTGPLVALLDRSEPDHLRVRQFMATVEGLRLVTTGAIITEAFYFLAEIPGGPASLAAFFATSGIEVREAFHAEGLAHAVRLMSKYSDPPMDFPDATLIHVAEETNTDQILTLDRRGFSVFRFGKNRRFKLVLDTPG